MKKALILIMASLMLVLTGCSGGSVESPPDLNVLINKDEIELQPQHYNWMAIDKSGNQRAAAVQGEMTHPLEMNYLSPYEVDDSSLKFYSDPTPKSFTVRCWPDTALGDSSAPAQEAETSAGKFELNPGGWIYHISGEWEGGQSGKAGYYKGTADYVVYIIREK